MQFMIIETFENNDMPPIYLPVVSSKDTREVVNPYLNGI
jgi:hypothetical protein